MSHQEEIKNGWNSNLFNNYYKLEKEKAVKFAGKIKKASVAKS